MYKKILQAEICLGLFLLFSCGGKEKQPQNQQNKPIAVSVMIAKPSTTVSFYEANGTVLAMEAIDVYPEISGRITYLNILEGEKVSAGTILAKINNADLTAQLTGAKAQLVLAEKNKSRLEQLFVEKALAQSEYDAVQTQVVNLKSQVDVLEAQIEKTIIRAPFSGTIGLRNVSNGAYVNQNTLITSLQQRDALKIDFTLPELNARNLKKGDIVKVAIAGAAESVEARVASFESRLDVGSRNWKVRAYLLKADVLPGSFAKVFVPNKNGGNMINIPSSAVIPEARFKKVVLAKNGIAVFSEVITGNRVADSVEVISGINLGDSVVVSGMLYAKPKATLTIKKVFGASVNSNQR
jgi:membrane fusion protein (multidrug efflux system)